ncbi:hypothetical protein Hdeb2414_s0006g00188061 [Helianthus debilis subsp. tardiflorus]
MELVSDDKVVPEVQVITSDSESASDGNLDDFQTFALLDDIIDDDVLAIPPLLNDIVIMGHPEGEHIVEVIPFDVIPLAAIPFIVNLDSDDDVIPVIPVDHVDADLGDGEVFDLVILDVASPVVSVIDISSDSDTDSDILSGASVTSSALQAVGRFFLFFFSVELTYKKTMYIAIVDCVLPVTGSSQCVVAFIFVCKRILYKTIS